MGKVKTFRIRIQGIEHIVEVEELNGSMHSSPAVPSSPVHTVAEPVPPAAAPAAKAPTPTDGQTVTAPMPSSILKVNVVPGQAVTAGTVLCILEAMKMENEIMAPCDGTITQVLVSKGAIVDTNAPLFTFA